MSSSVPSMALEMKQLLKDFFTISSGNNPSKDKVFSWHRLLSCQGELEWLGDHPRQVLFPEVIFKRLIQAFIQGLQNGGETSRDDCYVDVAPSKIAFDGIG